MWINELNRKQTVTPAQSGIVTLSEDGQFGVAGCMESRSAPLFAPYGYFAVPKEGETALLIEMEGGYSVAGFLSRAGNLAPGELELRVPSGAFLRLCTDGTLQLNGYRIANAPTSGQEGFSSTHN